MRAYIRLDPKMVEEKLAAGYTLAQIGAYAMLIGQAEQQSQRGYFKSMALLRAAMDCMVEEHGTRARVSQHLSFLMEQRDVVKLDQGGYYVEGWREWQEGDHKPHERMELVRGRKGRPGDPESPGAKRTARWRAGNGVAADVTNSASDASHESAPCDVTMDAPSDVSHDPRTRANNVSRKQKAEGSSSSGGDTSQSCDGDTADERANGLSTEPTDVTAYGQRFMKHGRTPSAEDLEFLRSVSFEYDRLSPEAVLAAIDDVAARFLAQSKAMPPAKYLAGKLGDLQANASDAGVRPRSAARSPSGMGRIGDLLPRVLQ